MIIPIILLSVLLIAAISIIIKLYVSQRQLHAGADAEFRFKALANEIFAQNSRQFKADSEQRLTELLSPLKENLNEFTKAFTESYNKEARERYSLQDRIKELIELNNLIGRETRELSSALKGNTRVQGQWGEMILENILGHSGLRRGEEYTMQESVSTDSGSRLRADAVISYPDGRKVIIDSKVSIKAYLEMVSTTDDERRHALGKSHVSSIRSHINELKTKNYQDYIGDRKADFVIMFVPHEGAYLAAMQLDADLWQYAYDNRVIIVSPAHLLAIIKLIEQMWLHDRQTRNAIEIAREGGKLLDKFYAFLSDLDKIDASIKSAQKSYADAIIKLNGHGGIMSKAEKMRSLGAKTTKPIPQKFMPQDDSTQLN